MPYTDPLGRPPRARLLELGDESSELAHRRAMTGRERLRRLEELRAEVIKNRYGGRREFRRVYRLVER